MADASPTPRSVEVDPKAGLTITWSDGTSSRYSAAHLRRLSPSADARILRETLKKNPLTVLPASAAGSGASLRIEAVEPAGVYAIRIRFSDGHATGLYTWEYLHSIDPRASGAADEADAG